MARVEAVQKRPPLGQYQAAHRFVTSGDVRMDVDGARHDDLVGNIIGLVDYAAGGRFHDAAIANEDVANCVAPIGRIDYMTAGKTGQHGRAAGSFAMIWSRILATD